MSEESRQRAYADRTFSPSPPRSGTGKCHCQKKFLVGGARMCETCEGAQCTFGCQEHSSNNPCECPKVWTCNLPKYGRAQWLET